MRAIEDANRLDLELYDYARALFEEQLGRQRPDFGIELAAFKRVNGMLGRLVTVGRARGWVR